MIVEPQVGLIILISQLKTIAIIQQNKIEFSISYNAII